MPLVKIDLIRGTRSASEIRLIADVVQDVMLAHFAAPPRDRYQVRLYRLCTYRHAVSPSLH